MVENEFGIGDTPLQEQLCIADDLNQKSAASVCSQGGNAQTDAADFQASDEEKRGHCGMGVVGAHVWGRRTTSPMASPKNRPAVCPVCFWKALNL